MPRTLIVGINSTSITAAATSINKRFGVSDESFPNSFWPVTAWNGGAALAPMVVLPIMEKYGMRTGYLICYGLFTAFVIPQAVAPNYTTLIVCRFIAGCCGGVLQDVMDGVIADIWAGPEQRSLPVTIYVFSLLGGVTLGPVTGGAIVSTLYWRWYAVPFRSISPFS
jgi:MFS family permease